MSSGQVLLAWAVSDPRRPSCPRALPSCRSPLCSVSPALPRSPGPRLCFSCGWRARSALTARSLGPWAGPQLRRVCRLRPEGSRVRSPASGHSAAATLLLGAPVGSPGRRKAGAGPARPSVLSLPGASGTPLSVPPLSAGRALSRVPGGRSTFPPELQPLVTAPTPCPCPACLLSPGSARAACSGPLCLPPQSCGAAPGSLPAAAAPSSASPCPGGATAWRPVRTGATRPPAQVSARARRGSFSESPSESLATEVLSLDCRPPGGRLFHCPAESLLELQLKT